MFNRNIELEIIGYKKYKLINDVAWNSAVIVPKGFEFDVTIFPVNQPFVFAYHKCIDFNCLRV